MAETPLRLWRRSKRSPISWIPSHRRAGHDQAQALLECLWVFEEQRIVNVDLLAKVFQADEPRVRAAAIRTLGHWAERLKPSGGGQSNRADAWEPTLAAASRDPSPLVRAEAVKSAVEFADVAATEVVFEVASRPTDPELEAVLAYAKRSINVDAIVKDAIASGRRLSPAAQAYVLKNASIDDLKKLDRSEAVCRAILGRREANVGDLHDALAGLAEATKTDPLVALMNLIDQARQNSDGNVIGLGKLLVKQPAADLQRSSAKDRIDRGGG